MREALLGDKNGSNMFGAPLAGRLLVANPSLPDPHFDRTVVLILRHAEQGSVGLVLNRPSDLAVESPLPQWSSHASSPAVIFVGGPLNSDSAICLACRLADDDGDANEGAADAEASRFGRAAGERGTFDAGVGSLSAEIASVDLDTDPAQLGVGVLGVRVFAGYAGWSPGQLEAELAAHAWWVLDAEAADVLSDEPDHLWKRVLRRQGGQLALVAAYPDDLNAN